MDPYRRDEVVVHDGLYYPRTVPTALSFDTSIHRTLKNCKTSQQGGTEVEHYTQFDYSKIVKVDYGTDPKTRQELYDVLVGYGEWLQSRGWIFDSCQSRFRRKYGLRYSKRIFIRSLGKWQIGNYVVLSP